MMQEKKQKKTSTIFSHRAEIITTDSTGNINMHVKCHCNLSLVSCGILRCRKVRNDQNDIKICWTMRPKEIKNDNSLLTAAGDHCWLHLCICLCQLPLLDPLRICCHQKKQRKHNPNWQNLMCDNWKAGKRIKNTWMLYIMSLAFERIAASWHLL